MLENFRPKILPELSPPEEVLTCERCELSRQRSRVIWGEGNPLAPVFVVLDNPGAREDKDGNPFLCGTRETLLRAVREVGIPQEHLHISYILKCRPLSKYNKPKARKTCIKFLWNQLKRSHKVVMTLGDVATASFFEDPAVKVKDLRGGVHELKGKKVVASYHPLAVRRRPVLQKVFLEDWGLVAAILKKGKRI